MRRRALLALAALAALWSAPLAHAVEPEEQLANPRLEARARTISRELRCVVCESETIDESPAPVAKALRKLVRDRLQAGDSDAQVIAAVTARYGDYVLLKPRFDPTTALLWLGPFLVLAAGGGAALIYVRRQAASADSAPAPLSEDERRLLEAAFVAEHARTDARES
jgi:cytochrome c-type biogenesis protein CcmH